MNPVKQNAFIRAACDFDLVKLLLYYLLEFYIWRYDAICFFSIEKKLSLLLPNSQIIRTAGSFFPPKLFFRKCKARSTALKAKIAEYYLMNGNEYCKNHKELMAYEIMMRALHCSLQTLERWALSLWLIPPFIKNALRTGFFQKSEKGKKVNMS